MTWISEVGIQERADYMARDHGEAEISLDAMQIVVLLCTDTSFHPLMVSSGITTNVTVCR